MVGGFVILAVERFAKPGSYLDVAQLPLPKAFAVGLMQCIAMIPGVSRSGATIMGGLSLGLNRRTAAEFSFFLAVPTMLGATVKQLWDHRHEMASGSAQIGWGLIAIGSVVSFVVALAVIKAFIAYISRHGFTPFAIYRIIIGGAAIVLLGMHATS